MKDINWTPLNNLVKIDENLVYHDTDKWTWMPEKIK